MKYTIPVVIVLVLGGLAGGFYYWRTQQRAAVVTAPVAPPPAAAVPVKPSKPPIHYPVPAPAPAVPAPKPLPLLAKSDVAMMHVLTGFFGRGSVEELFVPRDIIHRFVVLVDSLPHRKLPMRFRLFKPVSGRFLATGPGDAPVLDPDNYRRYTPFVLMAQAVSSKTLVATYIRFYPLLQQEYKRLGYPHGYFNDRVVAAIDNLLATPDVKGAIKLVRPNVLYQFADPKLEALTAGQKILLRMGPENAARIKAKLEEIRSDLTGQVSKR
ncbi:MAG: DUF3014 domain-containing protein [Acidiferrobacterales bacterium]